MSWVRLLYTCPLASVSVNGKTWKFTLEWGTSLSPLLFAIAIEPLAILLRASAWGTGKGAAVTAASAVHMFLVEYLPFKTIFSGMEFVGSTIWSRWVISL